MKIKPYFVQKLPALFIYCITFYVLLIPIAIVFNYWFINISVATCLGFILTFFLALTDYNRYLAEKIMKELIILKSLSGVDNENKNEKN